MMTRNDRRRFPFLFAAIAVLTLAGAALGLLFSTAQAQEAETLVSNIGQGETLTVGSVIQARRGSRPVPMNTATS